MKRGGLDPMALMSTAASNSKKKELTEEMKLKKTEKAVMLRNKKLEETETQMQEVVSQLLYRKPDKEVEKQVIHKPTKHEILLNSMGSDIIHYVDNENGKTVSYPEGVEIVKTNNNTGNSNYPQVIKCSAPNCNNPKRYNCSKNNLPVCTYKCYQKVVNL
eukprot:gene588-734_t